MTETLGIERFEELAEIEWPSIPKKEIQAKSKGHFISKGLVVFQTAWFIAQCIARRGCKTKP